MICIDGLSNDECFVIYIYKYGILSYMYNTVINMW